jgi:ABC-2 type transport system ATP-binding protein
MSGVPAIDVNRLTKTYGSLAAVDEVSFTVSEKEVFAFLGPNGAGKTTTIEILQCLRRPTSGEARVLGLDVKDPGDQREIKSRIGVLPQEFSALDKLTVRENISLFAGMYDDPKDPDDLISLLDLEDKSSVRFDELSGGLKQRVGIAAALVNEPELVFLDEPTTGLDPRSRREVWAVIRKLKREGATVFLTTHYMEEAQRLADTIAVIHKGAISAIGSPARLLEEHGGGTVLIVEDATPSEVEQIEEEVSDVHRADDNLYIHVDGLPQIAKTIEVLGRIGIVRGIQVRNPTIEDVFLNLIGTRLTAEGELA